MKPKVSIKKCDIKNSPYDAVVITVDDLGYSSIGYQVLWDGAVIAKSTDKNMARRTAYHLRTKWDK